jgi:hypothetical protein
MRAVVALGLAGCLFVASALAAANEAPLAPGKPAGAQQADIENGGVLLVLSIAGLAAGIALIASGTQGKSVSPASTVTPAAATTT